MPIKRNWRKQYTKKNEMCFTTFTYMIEPWKYMSMIVFFLYFDIMLSVKGTQSLSEEHVERACVTSMTATPLNSLLKNESMKKCIQRISC